MFLKTILDRLTIQPTKMNINCANPAFTESLKIGLGEDSDYNKAILEQFEISNNDQESILDLFLSNKAPNFFHGNCD